MPRGSWVKRRGDGSIDYVAPLPSPFDYGCVPDRPGGDGDPLDVLLIGTRLPAGAEREIEVRGVVRLLDDGRPDDKLVCADHPPTALEWAAIRWFFRAWVVGKRALGLWRGRRGPTRMLGVEVRP